MEIKIFWINLGRIQNTLSITDEEFAKYLGMGHPLFIKHRRACTYLPLNCVFELAERFGFHFENLLQESFDIKTIFNKIHGISSFSKRYSNASYSSTRPISNVVSYIEKTKGERAKLNLLRKFQISETLLEVPDIKTNIHLMTDSLQYLRKTYQLKDIDILSMGQMTPFTSVNQDLARELSNKKNIYELVDYFFEELCQSFDKNHSYKLINLSDDYAVIEIKAYQDVLDELKLTVNQFGSENLCLTRLGVLSSLTWFKYGRFTPVKKITSAFDGSPSNQYLMEISSFKNLISINSNFQQMLQ